MIPKPSRDDSDRPDPGAGFPRGTPPQNLLVLFAAAVGLGLASWMLA